MKTLRLVGLIGTLTVVGGIAAASASAADRLNVDARDSLQAFRASSGKMQRAMDAAYGYAIFPSVDKGAAGVGAAKGRGQVYEDKGLAGLAKLTQVTVGAQLGGQSYAELILFRTKESLDEFKDGRTVLSAGVSAVVAGEGAGDEAKYQHGVLVCTMARSGLMFEASLGGQHFKYTPIDRTSSAPEVKEPAPWGGTAPSSSSPTTPAVPAAPLTPPAGVPAQ